MEYGTSQGNEELRELVSKKLEVEKKDIVITNGSAFGIFLAMLCSCDHLTEDTNWTKKSY